MTDRPAPPAMPSEVAAAFAAFPEPVRRNLIEVRHLIFETAASTPGVGRITETLKWGEPAYLTEATGSGSTIRLGRPKAPAGVGAVFFNCKTTLLASFRAHFPDAFVYEGDRAILLDPAQPLRAEPLALCIGMALTYHRTKRGG